MTVLYAQGCILKKKYTNIDEQHLDIVNQNQESDKCCVVSVTTQHLCVVNHNRGFKLNSLETVLYRLFKT